MYITLKVLFMITPIEMTDKMRAKAKFRQSNNSCLINGFSIANDAS